MIPQVSSQPQPPTTVLLDDEFEPIKQIMKEGANEVLDKTSGQAKEVFKNQADTMIDQAVNCLTGPMKVSNTTVSPGPVATLVNQSIDACGAPISKKVAGHSINKSVDVGARKVVDVGVNYSIVSFKSLLIGIYDRTNAYFLTIQETKVEKVEEEKAPERDALDEPVVEEAQSILDGYPVLSEEKQRETLI